MTIQFYRARLKKRVHHCSRKKISFYSSEIALCRGADRREKKTDCYFAYKPSQFLTPTDPATARVCAVVAQGKRSGWDEPSRPPLLPAAFFGTYSPQSAAVTNVRSHTGPANEPELRHGHVTATVASHSSAPLTESLLPSRPTSERGPPSLSTE